MTGIADWWDGSSKAAPIFNGSSSGSYMSKYPNLTGSNTQSWGSPDALAGTSLSGMGNYGAGTQAAADATGAGGWSDWLFGGTDKSGNKSNGSASTMLGVAEGLVNAYQGFQKFNLSKDIFNENKKQFAMNFGTQAKLTNGRLADRQAARVASNPGAYQSVGDYMNTNRVG